MTRCTRCIIPESFPGVTFDEDGICSLCRSHSNTRRRSDEEALLRLVESARSGSRFDCVVPLSGGKDSTYILYLAVRELGLRVIAANHDQGYQSDMARANVRHACEALGVPLVTSSPDHEAGRLMLREMLHVSEILGCFTRTCTDCEFMLRSLAISSAREHDVPFILWGSSSLESPDDADYDEYRHGRGGLEILSSKLQRLRELALTPGQAVALAPHVLSYASLSARRRRSMGAPLKYVVNPFGLVPFPEASPAIIHFFDYADWDPHAATEVLERELGWRHPEGREARFDCRLYCFVEHRELELTGLTDSGAIASRLIREGRLTREQALAMEEETRRRIISECETIVREAGLPDYRMPDV